MNTTVKKTLKALLPPAHYHSLAFGWRTKVITPLQDASYFARRHLSQLPLQKIGERHGTDKSAQSHSFEGKTFLQIYERYVRQFRDRSINLLEIGVLGGASLRTWRDFGPKWRIFGMDINPTARATAGERIQIAIGSQDDPEFLRSCFGPETQFDIIVDDGSHVNQFTLASFRVLFYDRLKPGGVYIIEDLGSSYGPMDHVLDLWPGMHLNDRTKDYSNDRRLMSDFFESIIHDLDFLRGPVEYIHFWSRFAVIGKRTQELG